MAQVKVAFKNVLDKKATYKLVESDFLTLAAKEYARLYCENSEIYHAVMQEKITIKLNDKVISVNDWSITPLRDGDKILITPAIEMDDSGLLGVVLGAILIVASVLLAPYTGGASFTLMSLTFNTSIFLMGAAMILGGLMQMLMAPDLPTFNTSTSGKGSTTYSWSGIKTQARPDQPIPVVFGKHKIGGNLINIFTERQGADDYLFMLIALAEGEIAGICTKDNTNNVCTTTDSDNAAYKHPSITLSDQPIQNYTDVEWWYRNGTNMPDASVLSTDPSAQNIIPYFTGSRMQMDDGRRIDDTGITYTTSKEVDMATIQVRFPNMFVSSGGEVSATTVHYKIEFRKNGTSPWTEYTDTKYTPLVTARTRSDGTTSPLRGWGTDLAFTNDTPGYFDKGSYILSDQKPDSFWFQITRAIIITPKIVEYGWNINSRQAMKWEYDITFKNLTTNETWIETIKYEEIATRDQPWHAPYYVHPNVKKLVIGNYILNATLSPQVGDTYILSAVKGSGELWRTITEKSKTGFWDTNTIDFHTTSGGLGQQIYDIRVTRQEPVSDTFETSNDMILASVIERINGDFIYPNTALLGFKIKATGQLSGQPPNVVTEIKGMKIDVPDHSGSERFEELFWDEDNDRWEYDGAARTWDGTTYTEEYSNNPMLCLKDLMTNKIYGLGEYTDDNDFNDANTLAIIKECHKEYSPTDTDHLLWWSAGNTGEFVKAIEDGMSSQYQNTLTINSSVPSISYSGNYTHVIPVRLDAPLKSGQRYRFSITLGSTSHNVDIELAVRPSTGSWYQIGNYTAPEISNKGNGTHTYDFTAPFAGINNILITIKKNGGPVNISGTVVDISLDSVQGNGLNRAWHYHTYNGALDSKQSALSALLEFTNSFRVWPSWYEGTFKFIMDKDETPIHTISISNTMKFGQSWVPLSEVPYRIVAQFTDEDQSYDLTQIMIQSTDTNIPKSNEQTIGLKGITSRKRAEREVKFRLSKFVNSTHSINIRCGMDMIHATAGDIINVSNDLPQWGHGSRVASYNAGNKYIYLTEPFTVTNATPADIMIKYQDINNDFQTATLNVVGVSDGDILKRITTKSWPANPNINGPAVMGLSTSYVKPFRLLSVTRTGEEEVEANALEHLPTLYSSEPTLVINQDYETTKLVNTVTAKPGVPINVKVVQLPAIEGIGWDIGAEHADIRSQEIIVQFSEDGEVYNQIGSILQGQTGFVYTNNHLQTGKTYQFRFIAKGVTGNSSSVYVGAYLEKKIFRVDTVTGMQIKGSSPNVQTWDGLDVTVQWNPVGQNLYKSGLMDFYTVRVYSNTYDPDDQQNNLIRTAYPKITEYRYTYDMNVEDSGAEFPYATLIFVITVNLINGIESVPSRPFSVTNVAPSTPQNLTSHPAFRSVGWRWSANDKTDFKEYKLRSRLESTNATPATTGAWSAWTTQGHNTYTRTVNATENDIFKWRTRVYFEVKAIDLYNSSSNAVAGNNTNQTFHLETIDIATFAVTAPKIATFAITTEKIASLAVNTSNIATFAVTEPKIENGAVASIKIKDAAIEAAKIGNLAVTNAKIQNLAVSSGKIASLAVGVAQIASLAVTTAKIASLAVAAAQIASLAVTNAKIQNLAVSSGKIANLAVTEGQIGNLAVTTAKIASLAVNNAQIYSIEADKIVANYLSAISADFGIITAGQVSGVVLIGNTIQTAATGAMVKITSEGMTLHETSAVGKYGGDFKYGDGTHYGSGALAYIHHSSQKVPFYISAEQTVADYHLYNRASEPSGVCEIGDLISDGGKLKICTAAGTGAGATWTVVGAQS